MNEPHKHAELIKAWADGAEIETLDCTGKWCYEEFPEWFMSSKYRIKPEEKKPVVRWLWTGLNGDRLSPGFFTEEQAASFGWTVRLEWSRTEFPE